MSNDKHKDNKEVTKHTVLSGEGLKIKFEDNNVE